MSECKLCGQKTRVVVNIDFVAVPVCDHCCLTITGQTVQSLRVRRWHKLDGSPPHTIITSEQPHA
jgi:ribosome-binding protein aMBF1 (putative translation factor)